MLLSGGSSDRAGRVARGKDGRRAVARTGPSQIMCWPQTKSTPAHAADQSFFGHGEKHPPTGSPELPRPPHVIVACGADHAGPASAPSRLHSGACSPSRARCRSPVVHRSGEASPRSRVVSPGYRGVAGSGPSRLERWPPPPRSTARAADPAFFGHSRRRSPTGRTWRVGDGTHIARETATGLFDPGYSVSRGARNVTDRHAAAVACSPCTTSPRVAAGFRGTPAHASHDEERRAVEQPEPPSTQNRIVRSPSPPPVPESAEEAAARRVQAIQRGRQGRQRAVQEAAARRVQAIQRGRQGRQRAAAASAASTALSRPASLSRPGEMVIQASTADDNRQRPPDVIVSPTQPPSHRTGTTERSFLIAGPASAPSRLHSGACSPSRARCRSPVVHRSGEASPRSRVVSPGYRGVAGSGPSRLERWPPPPRSTARAADPAFFGHSRRRSEPLHTMALRPRSPCRSPTTRQPFSLGYDRF